MPSVACHDAPCSPRIVRLIGWHVGLGRNSYLQQSGRQVEMKTFTDAVWRCIKSTCTSLQRLQGEEMRYALDLLQDCTSARMSEWVFYTAPEGHQLFTPTLQLRCSAVEATANILKSFLPSELNTQTWGVKYLLCTVAPDICLAPCFGCRRLHHLACKRV